MTSLGLYNNISNRPFCFFIITIENKDFLKLEIYFEFNILNLNAQLDKLKPFIQ